MKLLIIVLLFMANTGFSKCKDVDFCNVKLNSVYDGDTFYVDIPKLHGLIGTRLGIRVAKVDTPEIRAKSTWEREKAREAKAFVESSLQSAKKINLVDCERGKYFRLVCTVIYDGKNLTEELIKSGNGKPYK